MRKVPQVHDVLIHVLLLQMLSQWAKRKQKNPKNNIPSVPFAHAKSVWHADVEFPRRDVFLNWLLFTLFTRSIKRNKRTNIRGR